VVKVNRERPIPQKKKQKKRKLLIHAGEGKMQGCSAAELCITLAFL
jgi:hypothetical protein